MTDTFKIKMGFLNTPYTKKSMKSPMAAARAAEAKRQHYGYKPRRKYATDIGSILEHKFGVIDYFVEAYSDEIQELVLDKLGEVVIEELSDKVTNTGDKLVSRMKGRTREIDKLFRNFLDMDEMSGVVQIEAAIEQGRPAFIDTGIYRASFRSWIEK